MNDEESQVQSNGEKTCGAGYPVLTKGSERIPLLLLRVTMLYASRKLKVSSCL